jgi:hypothetical protein
MGNISMSVNGQVSTAKAVTKQTQAQATAQAKITKDKKLGLAIDKANLLLGKGTDLFNMDAIQLNAALINQAEQLGKVTNQAQLLSITTDMARLKIKQDIANLEDAIASKDEARITAASNQLDKDLKIYSALTNQSLKLTDIKSILDSILPRDLINLANLTEAIRLLTIINNGKTPSVVNPVVSAATPGAISAATTPNNSGAIGSAAAGGYTDSQNAARIAAEAIGSGIFTAVRGSGAGAGAGEGQIPRGVIVNINAGTIANPDELTGLIQDTIIRINKQGDYLTTAGAL